MRQGVPHRKGNAMEKYLIDYGSKTGPIRAYAPPPTGSMPTGGRRGPVKGFSSSARRNFVREIHRLTVRWEKLRPLSVTLTLPGRNWEQIDYQAAFKRWRAASCRQKRNSRPLKAEEAG